MNSFIKNFYAKFSAVDSSSAEKNESVPVWGV